jgi:hypothetical protein
MGLAHDSDDSDTRGSSYIKVNGGAYQRGYVDARIGLAMSLGRMYFL